MKNLKAMTKPDLQEANDEEVEAFHCLFPYKLHRTLSLCEQQGLCHIVSWLECGTAFRVHNIKDFEVYVLPQLGRLSRYKSFLRQLHLYKFTPVLSSKSGGGLFSSKKGGGARAYQHAYFRRDHISLCRGVLRGKVLRSPNSRPGTAVRRQKEQLFNRTAANWEDDTAGTSYTDTTRNIFTPTPAPSSSGDCSSTRVASCCHLVGKNIENGNEDSATELASALPPVVASLFSSQLLIEHQEQHKLLGNPKADQNSRSAGRESMRASSWRERQDASSMLMPSPSPDFASCSDIGGESTILDHSCGPAVDCAGSGLLFLENLHGNTHSLDIEDEIINTFMGPLLAAPY